MGLTQNLGLLSTAIKANSTLNVGIGTSSPTSKLQVEGYGTANSIMTYPVAKFYGTGTGGLNIGTDGTNPQIATDSSGVDLTFLTRVAGVFSERMRITSAGNVLIGSTTFTGANPMLEVRTASAREGITIQCGTGGYSAFAVRGISNEPYFFVKENGNTLFGTNTDSGQRMTVNGNIFVSLAGSAHLFLDTTPFGGAYAYNMQIKNNAGNGNFYIQRTSDGTGVYIPFGGTSWGGVSDERLKTDLVAIENATEKVSQLRTVTGRFKTDEVGKSRSFFIAQDMQKVFPEAVNYDEENDVWGIQYTDTIPLMAAAIKELKAEIDQLKAK